MTCPEISVSIMRMESRITKKNCWKLLTEIVVASNFENRVGQNVVFLCTTHTHLKMFGLIFLFSSQTIRNISISDRNEIYLNLEGYLTFKKGNI